MNHVINQLVVELQFPETGEEQGREMQDELMRTYRHLLLQEIEKVLDEMAAGSDVIRIDHLEIHLGAIDKLENIAQSIRETVRNVIMRIMYETAQSENGKAIIQLYDEAGNHFTVHAERLSALMHDEQVLFHFLQEGIALPGTTGRTMRERAVALLDKNPAAWTRIIFRLREFKRLCLQSDEPFLRKLFCSVFNSGEAKIKTADNFRALLPESIKTVFWQTAFETGDHTEELLLENIAARLSDFEFGIIRTRVHEAPELALALLQLQREDEKKLPVFSSRLLRLLHEWENILQRQHASALLTSRLFPLKQLLQELADSGHHDTGTRETMMQLALIRLQEIEHEVIDTPLHEALEQTAAEIRQEMKRAVETPEEPGEEPLYTTQAGLVLLQPYLAAFFENTGLLVDDDFVSEEARYTAVEALHFLATGEQREAEEHELVFHKLICGIPLRQPLPEFRGLDAAIVEEAELMLSIFIQNWEALKLTSAAQVRERFLQRNGKLQRDGDYWYLKVETDAIDVLVDSLPYTLHRLELPWLETPLFTEW